MGINEVIQDVLYVTLLALIGYLGPKLAAAVEKIGGANAVKILQEAASVAVHAAEQIYGKGPAAANNIKLQYAITAAKGILDSKGVPSSDESITSAIEAAVLQLKRTMPGPMELVAYSDTLKAEATAAAPAPAPVLDVSPIRTALEAAQAALLSVFPVPADAPVPTEAPAPVVQ